MKTWARMFSTYGILKGLIALIYKEFLEINSKPWWKNGQEI